MWLSRLYLRIALPLRYRYGMAEHKITSVRVSPELHAQLVEIKRKTAVIEYLLIGRASRYAGKGIEDVLAAGAEAELARIAEVWTPEHERLLNTLAPPSTLRGSHAPQVSAEIARGIVDASREAGFGPGTPQPEKVAESARLRGEGVPNGLIGELFGVSAQRVSQWLAPKAAGKGRLERARSRSRSAAPVRHVTPGLEPAAGSVPFRAAEAKP